LAQLLVLSSAPGGGPVLPSLELLSHRVRQIPAEPAQLVNAPSADIIFVDARLDLVGAKSLCKILNTTGLDAPLLLVVTEGGLTAVSTDWGVDDVILVTAGPAEVDARIRLAIGRMTKDAISTRIQTSGITIDESSYSAKVHGKPLDLTYKEFQLLHFFATHPSRVFTREQLLSEVWGYDYFGGTRTVDVHVRRLRAKLGDLEQLIGTVRNVGYRFVLPPREAAAMEPATAPDPVPASRRSSGASRLLPSLSDEVARILDSSLATERQRTSEEPPGRPSVEVPAVQRKSDPDGESTRSPDSRSADAVLPPRSSRPPPSR